MKTTKLIMVIALLISALPLLSSVGFANGCPPPQNESFKVGIFCEETGNPVPEGYKVWVIDHGSLVVGADGYTECLENLEVGAYYIRYKWGRWYYQKICVVESEECQTFNFTVHNPVIKKKFVVDDCSSKEPLENLQVNLTSEGSVIAVGYTNQYGKVKFDGSIVEVGVTYYLNWTWENTQMSEGPIAFNYYCGKLYKVSWCKTNTLKLTPPEYDKPTKPYCTYEPVYVQFVDKCGFAVTNTAIHVRASGFDRTYVTDESGYIAFGAKWSDSPSAFRQIRMLTRNGGTLTRCFTFSVDYWVNPDITTYNLDGGTVTTVTGDEHIKKQVTLCFEANAGGCFVVELS